MINNIELRVGVNKYKVVVKVGEYGVDKHSISKE